MRTVRKKFLSLFATLATIQIAVLLSLSIFESFLPHITLQALVLSVSTAFILLAFRSCKNSIVKQLELLTKELKTHENDGSHIVSTANYDEEFTTVIETFNKVFEHHMSDKEAVANKLAHASKMASLGTLGAGVAHELNNPLVAVKGFAQTILSKPDKTDEIKESAKKIILAANRMHKIIGHLTAFSRESSSGDWLPFSLNQVIDDGHMLMENQLVTNKISLKQNLDPDLPNMIGDKDEVESIIQNLITNSRDAFDMMTSPPQERCIEISSYAKDDHIYLSYRDNAGGIPTEHLTHIFDPFFTTKEVGKGTGLGLSIIYDIVKKHNGDLEVHTDPEGGSTQFLIAFPATSKPVPGPPKEEKPIDMDSLVADVGQLKVLLVDDEPYVLEVLEDYLEEYYEVEPVSDPRVAMELLHNQKFDVVISDLRMPHLTGTEVLQEAKKIQPHAATILMTGQSRNDAEVLQALQTSADGLLTKPFGDPDKVIQTISRLFAENNRAA